MEALRAARAASPLLPMGLLVGVPEDNHLAFLEELGAVSMHCHHQHLTAELVSYLHRDGYRVMTYTVNELSRLSELLEMGVDGVFTDNLHEMAKHFPFQR